MAMGHKQPYTAHIIAKPGMNAGRAAVNIAVAGDLMHRDMGIQFFQRFPIVIIIAQMHDGLGLYFLHTAAHKAHCRMGIGQN
jgi:hypothetical protein